MYQLFLNGGIRITIEAETAEKIYLAITKGARVYRLPGDAGFISLRPAPTILKNEIVEHSTRLRLKEQGREVSRVGNTDHARPLLDLLDQHQAQRLAYEKQKTFLISKKSV